jgi:hypothetical protein
MQVKAERFLTDLQSGVYDDVAFSIENAVTRRAQKIRSKRTVEDYSIGERVVINSLCSHPALHDIECVVAAKWRKSLIVEGSRGGEEFRYAMSPVLLDKGV